MSQSGIFISETHRISLKFNISVHSLKAVCTYILVPVKWASKTKPSQLYFVKISSWLQCLKFVWNDKFYATVVCEPGPGFVSKINLGSGLVEVTSTKVCVENFGLWSVIRLSQNKQKYVVALKRYFCDAARNLTTRLKSGDATYALWLTSELLWNLEGKLSCCWQFI